MNASSGFIIPQSLQVRMAVVDRTIPDFATCVRANTPWGKMVVDPRKPVQCFGREASARAHELLDGQTVSLELDRSQDERDIYGRLLAYIWLPGGRNFGEVMIADSYAHEYTYDLPYAYQDIFKVGRSAERRAPRMWP